MTTLTSVRITLAALLAISLTACEERPAETAPPAPVQSPADAAPAPAAEPAPVAPPTDPSEPSTDPGPPSAANEPEYQTMHPATPSAKISVPVELRYYFETAPEPNQPATLHLAATSRVPGQNLSVAVTPSDGLRVAAGALDVRKVDARNVYRQQLSVTRLAASARELRVMVRMDVAAGSGFGIFTVPLDGQPAAGKRDLVKQR